MLDTPAEVRAAHRMRVRFLSGVKAGTISDIPSVSIVPLRESEARPELTSNRPEPASPTLRPTTGPIRRGVTVRLLDDKAGFDWKVVQIIPDGKIEVATTIFERRTTLTVPRERVQVLGRASRAARFSVQSDDASACDAFDQSAWVSKNLSPKQPRRHIDVVAESIVLGPRCLNSCRSRFYRGASDAECADLFRSDVRMKGVIQRDRPRGMLEGRIRVQGRFELILPKNFRAGEVTTIEDPRLILDLRPQDERPRRPRSPGRRRDKGRHHRPKGS